MNKNKHKICFENEGKYKGCYVYYVNGKPKSYLIKKDGSYRPCEEGKAFFAPNIHRLSNLEEYELRLYKRLKDLKKDFINRFVNIKLNEEYLNMQIEDIEKLFGLKGKDITEDYLQTNPFSGLFLKISIRISRIFPETNEDVSKIRHIYREWIVEEKQTIKALKHFGDATVLLTVLTWKYYNYLLEFKSRKYKGKKGYINEHYGRYITYANDNNNNGLYNGYNDTNELEEYELMVRYKLDILKNEFENTYVNTEFELKREYLDTEIEDIEKLFGFNGKDISEDYLQIQRFWKLFFEIPPLQKMFPETTKDVLKIRRIRREWIIKKNQTQAMLDECGKGIVINTVKIFQYYKYLTAFRSKEKAPQRQHLNQLEQPNTLNNKEVDSKKINSDKLDTIVEANFYTEPILDNESKEHILIGEVITMIAKAGHIFRPTPNSDWGIDGEIEFKNKKSIASGKRVYVQLKSGESYLKTRKRDGKEIFRIKNERHITYWQSQHYPVMLIIRSANGKIKWMNITEYLKTQIKNTKSIVFLGEGFSVSSINKLKMTLYPQL